MVLFKTYYNYLLIIIIIN